MEHSLYAYLARQSSEELEESMARYAQSQKSDIDRIIIQMLEEILRKRKIGKENK